MSESTLEPLQMRVRPQANIIDGLGTSVPAQTAADARKVLVQTARLQGRSILVGQQGYNETFPRTTHTLRIHADGHIESDPVDVQHAEWTVAYHSWTVDVPGQSPYLTAGIDYALADAQNLANDSSLPVSVHFEDIKDSNHDDAAVLIRPNCTRAAESEMKTPRAASVSQLQAESASTSRADAPAGPDESAAIRFSRAKQPAPTGPALIGWRGAMNRTFYTRLGPGGHEKQLRAWRNAIQRGLNGHKTICGMNLKGGVGKTTFAFMLAATFGRIRGGNVVAWDNNENQGNLDERSRSANHDHTVIDLLDNIDEVRAPGGAEKLVNYVRPQGEDKFHVLSSANRASNQVRINRETFSQAHAALREFYHLTVIDTGNATNASTWQATAEAADLMVMVTTNKEDGARKAFATIDDLITKGHADKLANGIAVINQPSNASPDRLQRIIDGMRAHVRACVVIPFDPALDEGEEISYEALNSMTKEAYMKAAALIINGL
ncbi:AAA family ATPase [Pseudarthrobacter psychrotolerans]|uniref:AAA family ATPase n=1 Tax=Pseudarthrobacter psychrotolerans TaxID=2697569 RepID=A0A6P1NM25_9MICC|nr:AAA family ATPase [Pseudarthrobacter psychrotolerans]QHK18602.1 AAA family ATPase [Pseudarthrobacter psychrotolerans]